MQASMRIEEVVDLLIENTGYEGSDVAYKWFEEIYRLIRSRGWHWNRRFFTGITAAAITDSVNTYTWTAGDYHMNAALPIGAFTYEHCGRVVIIDDILYTIERITTAPNRIYFDRPLHTTEATGVNITAYRRGFALKTSLVYDVKVDGLDVPNLDMDDSVTTYDKLWVQRSTAEQPQAYMCRDNVNLPVPKELPYVTGTIAGTIEAGEYQYFWAYQDVESGLYSTPGPILTYNAVLNTDPIFDYGNGLEGEVSYKLVLFRSTANPSRTRPAMYKIGEKDPTVVLDTIQDGVTNAQIVTAEEYYEGDWTTIHFWPIPDSLLPYDIYAQHNWGGRGNPNESISLGRDNQVLELLRLGFTKLLTVRGREHSAHLAAIIAFRRQLAYLLKNDSPTSAGDPGIGRIKRMDGVVGSDAADDIISSFTWNP